MSAFSSINLSIGKYIDVVDSIDALRAYRSFNLKNGDAILVASSGVVGDADGGAYVWAEKSTLPDDNVNAIKSYSTLDSGRWVKMFGRGLTGPASDVPGPTGPRGSVGPIGGNVMAIGLFTSASNLVVDAGANLLQTSGYSKNGIGVARYVFDSTVDSTFVASHPNASFLVSNGRGYRLAEQTFHPFMFGALPSTGVEYTNVESNKEVPFDCSPAIDAMIAYARSRPERPILDFRSRGLGISRAVQIQFDTAGFFNSKPLRVFPGRLIAMSPVDNMVEITGNNIIETGSWTLIGGQWRVGGSTVDSAYYRARLAKNGILFKGVGGGRFGGAHVQGVRRYAVQFDKSFAAGNNSIGANFGKIVATHCGSSPSSGDFEITGTYTSPSGRVGGYDQNQSQDLLLVSQGAGYDPGDLEVGDLLEITSPDGHQQTVRVQALPQASNGTQRLVSVFPWVKSLTGKFRSYHGGALSTTHFNMANTIFDGVIALYCGTGWEMGCQYAPTMRTLLAEGTGCGLSFGNWGGGQEGMNLEHYHFENVRRAVVDTNTASVKNCRLRSASNLAFNQAFQFFNLCEVLAAGLVSNGTYYQFPRSTGLSFEMNGITHRGKGNGAASTLQAQSIYITLSNFPAFSLGPTQEYGNGAATVVEVLVDKSQVTFFGDKSSIEIPFHFFGAHSSGRLSQNIRFTLSSENQSGVTLNGGTADFVVDPTLYTDAPIKGRVVLVPDSSGNGNVDARVFVESALKPAG